VNIVIKDTVKTPVLEPSYNVNTANVDVKPDNNINVNTSANGEIASKDKKSEKLEELLPQTGSIIDSKVINILGSSLIGIGSILTRRRKKK